jgi:alpha-tubulin suppressor-like RCC1 family protein
MLRRVVVLGMVIALLAGGVVSADFSGAVVSDGTTATMRQAAAWKLALGERHTCVLTSTNAVKCWGNNTDGQLGIGSRTSVGTSPTRSVTGSANTDIGATAVAIAAGGWHTCAITTSGAVKCWGQGIYGQLGIGSTDSVGDEVGEMGAALPSVDLGADRTARQLALGETHSCALLDDFSVKCWGGNEHGQLGLGDTDWRGDEAGEMGDDLPAVNFGGATALHIAAGEYHTCAILSTDEMVCWGLNSSGQLGRGTTTTVGATSPFVANTPIALGAGRTAVAMALGDAHTCAVLDDSSIKCFGAGGNGRLGLGDTNTRGDGVNEMGDLLPAIDLGASRRVWAAAAGGSHTCVLLENTTMNCFGDGSYGQLGNDAADEIGDASIEMGDNLTAIHLGADVLAIGTGDAHTCAILVDATVKCWGNGTYGALGLDSTDHRGNEPNEMINLAAVNATASTTTEPGAVRSLTAVADETLVLLSWLAPSATGGEVVSDYVVEYREITSSSWITVADGVSDATSATVNSLSSGTTYAFRVAARNAVHTGMTTSASATPTTTTSTTTTTTTTTSTATSGGSGPPPTTTTTTPPITPTVFVTGPTATVIANTTPATRPISTFAPYSTQITSKHRVEIARFVRSVSRGDTVRCVVHSPSPTLVSRIMLRRAAAICAEVRRLAKGVRAITAVEPLPTLRQASKWGMSTASLARQVVLQKGSVGDRRFG